ncbi:MAG TPA: hypothetical protein VJN95_17495 [Gemmatimonadales bacterium]|nr:hypothetical protein [Gemmatimonadales bacterium]
MNRIAAIVLRVLVLAVCGAPLQAQASKATDSRYLYVWTAGADSLAQDYLAVYDVRPDSGRYGALVTTVPVGSGGNRPHHTEHALAADHQLFANGFASGRSWIFDLTDPVRPRIAGAFGDQAGYSHPHSFLRLPNGNVLATFQMRHDSTGMHPGGVAEMTTAGVVVRSSSAAGPGVPDGIRPYSAAIVPSLDRVVTTTTDMDQKNPHPATEIQVWKLSTLELLHTVALPPGPQGDENGLTAEPRLLGDGKTVLVSTFHCGLFLLRGLESEAPSGQLVASFPRKAGTNCAIPVVAGHYWLVTVPSIPAVVSLDIADPAHPREVSRVVLDSTDVPHWISLEPNQRRLVLTGYGTLRNRLLLVTFDPATGALALDRRFHPADATRPGFDVNGVPHGAVFSRP